MEQSHFERIISGFLFFSTINFAERLQIIFMIHFGHLLSDFLCVCNFTQNIPTLSLFCVFWVWIANILWWSSWVSECREWRFRHDSMSSHHFFRKFLCRMIRNHEKSAIKIKIEYTWNRTNHTTHFGANVITCFESKFVFIVPAAVAAESKKPA